MMLLPNAVAELGMVQKLAREGDTCEKSCVCDAAQCNPLTIIPMGLSAGFVALGSTAPVLPSFEPCPNLGSREIGRLLVPAARPYGRLPAGDSAAVRKGVPLHDEPQTRIGYHAPAL